MEWLNLHTKTFKSTAYLNAKPQQRSTWISLLIYCINAENGGLIADAKNWTDTQCRQNLGVRRSDLHSTCPQLGCLWEFIRYDLRVNFYPISKELETKAKRLAANATNNKRKQNGHANVQIVDRQPYPDWHETGDVGERDAECSAEHDGERPEKIR